MRGCLGLLLLASFGQAEGGDGLAWVKANAPPPGAVAAGEERGSKVYLCRGYLADGVHPGRFDAGVCLVPQKGVVERVKDFEFAAGGPVAWGRLGEGEPVAAGKQGGRRDLFACRGMTPEQVLVGKAYLDGPHAGSCYAGDGGKERELRSGFEVLLKPGSGTAR